MLVVLLGAPLAWARPPDRIDRLIALLETNRSHKIRMQVAAHLSRLKEERVTQALRRALSDEDAGVRRVAAASLQERGVKAVPLPPTRRAAHAAQAREREKQRLQREREALARVYISMGTLANSSGAGGKPLARIFEAALRRELGTVRGVTLTWEGAPPTAEELARRKMAGFVLDGAITTLQRLRRGEQLRYTCTVRISLATYPGNSMKAFYKGEASTKLPSGTPGREVERRIMHEVVREAARKAKQHFVQDYFAYKQVDLGER